MKLRDYVYVSEPVSKITEKENADFLLQLQKSILASLNKKELLNSFQYEQCILELEKQYSRKLHRQT